VTEPTVADRRVHPATVVLRFLKEAPSTLLALPAGVAILSRGDLYRALAVAAVAGVVFLFFNWLAWRRFRYGVGAREIVIESGILHRNRRSIPFDRVQDVDIERALLARLFGLAKVRIETGAGGKDEGVLDSVTLAEADRLRAAVRAWHADAGAATGVQLGEAATERAPEPKREGRLLFAMDVKRVLLFGLFSFSLVYIASLFAFLQTFDRLLPFDIYDPARWIGLVEHQIPQRFTFVAIAFVLFLAVVVGIVAGVLRTLARDYGYRLVAEGSRFRRERGLFTRTEAVIAKARVQLALTSTGPIRGRFGWSGLYFQTLGAASDGSGMQAAAPFAQRAEIEPILAEAGPFRLPPPPELTMVSNRHIVRALAASVAPALLAIGAASAVFRPALLLLLLVPLLGAGAALQRRFHRYALDGELLFIARGVWRRRLWVVPVGNAQAISVARSWLQRRLGLATVSIDTAGAPALKGARIIDLRLETAKALASDRAGARRAYSSGRKSGTER
jgi:putative membrane protein